MAWPTAFCDTDVDNTLAYLLTEFMSDYSQYADPSIMFGQFVVQSYMRRDFWTDCGFTSIQKDKYIPVCHTKLVPTNGIVQVLVNTPVKQPALGVSGDVLHEAFQDDVQSIYIRSVRFFR